MDINGGNKGMGATVSLSLACGVILTIMAIVFFFMILCGYRSFKKALDVIKVSSSFMK